jgi:esterase/lipase superfamily enzyme
VQIEYHTWYSENLNHEMELKVYGHYGIPIIIFPCSHGRFFDYENFGMIHAIESHINSGKVKLFTVDSIDNESWYNFSILPGDRSARHEAYDRYICNEVVPFIREHCQSDDLRIKTSGVSMGAYHAVNFFLKHPDLLSGAFALSGLYRLDRIEFQLQHFDLPFVYFNSPLTYINGITDEWVLDWYKQSHSLIYVGQGAWEEEALQDTRDLQNAFHEKGIPANFDYWGHDVNHDWPWWFKMMNHALEVL